MFTRKDVEDAYFARQMTLQAKVEECSAESLVRGLGGDEDPSLMESLKNGKEILAKAKVVGTNDRMDVTLSSSAAAEALKSKNINSPVIEVGAGWVGTSEMKKVVALKLR